MSLDGFRHLPRYLAAADQERLLIEIIDVVAAAPWYTPAMPRTGMPFSVQMTNCGPLGWVSDQAGGYRYQATHPHTGQPWPALPRALLELWQALAGFAAPPEACLVNYYTGKAKLGLHRDEDEQEMAAPVVSVSLGDDAWFWVGGRSRRDAKNRILLKSGDVVVLGGPARLAYHGIARIAAGSSGLLRSAPHAGAARPDWLTAGGRINLTLRRVTRQ